MPEGNAGKSNTASLIEKITAKLEALATLEIRTGVGTVRWKEGDPNAPVTSSNCKAIVSRIGLIDGDIDSQIDEEFVTGEYKDVREYHEERVQQGLTIIDERVKALKNLLGFARDLDGEST